MTDARDGGEKDCETFDSRLAAETILNDYIKRPYVETEVRFFFRPPRPSLIVNMKPIIASRIAAVIRFAYAEGKRQAALSRTKENG